MIIIIFGKSLYGQNKSLYGYLIWFHNSTFQNCWAIITEVLRIDELRMHFINEKSRFWSEGMNQQQNYTTTKNASCLFCLITLSPISNMCSIYKNHGVVQKLSHRTAIWYIYLKLSFSSSTCTLLDLFIALCKRFPWIAFLSPFIRNYLENIGHCWIDNIL